jgi:hypothetical protein
MILQIAVAINNYMYKLNNDYGPFLKYWTFGHRNALLRKVKIILSKIWSSASINLSSSDFRLSTVCKQHVYVVNIWTSHPAIQFVLFCECHNGCQVWNRKKLSFQSIRVQTYCLWAIVLFDILLFNVFLIYCFFPFVSSTRVRVCGLVCVN